MEQSTNCISLKEELASFGRYFDANSRCVLSAPFGEGKSYFLKEFIKEKSSEYDFITLYPTNYQVCDNKDVFEYIKRDVLLALLALNLEILERYDKARAQIVWDSVMSCKGDVVSCLPDINIGISGILGATIPLSKILNVMCVISDKIHSDEPCDGNPIKSYLDSIENQQGGIYEFNPTSNLIASLIRERKDNDRKVVLVIEDLDRIDPAHIFRILNVFSAHFSDDLDEEFTKNKFGFDKVMLLCDYDNIEKIYRHLYGETTDFKGYISKFSAVKPFQYCIREKISKYIGGLIEEYVKDPVVSLALANEIVVRTKPSPQKLIENIRNIKEQIRFSSKKYQVVQLNVKVQKQHWMPSDCEQHDKVVFNTLYVSTDKPLLSFLSISKSFSVDGRQILEQLIKKPKTYADLKRIDDLLGLLLIPLMPNLQSCIDCDSKYKLVKAPSSINELKISEDGEIIDIIDNPGSNNVIDFINHDDILECLNNLDKYLY